MDGNDDTLKALNNYVKITVCTDCEIFKTKSTIKWTEDLKWVQPVVRTIQTMIHSNGSGFFLNGNSANYKCFFSFETLTKD